MCQKKIFSFLLFFILINTIGKSATYYSWFGALTNLSSWSTSSVAYSGNGSVTSFAGSGDVWMIGAYNTGLNSNRAINNVTLNVNAAASVVVVNVSLTISGTGLLRGQVTVASAGTLNISNTNTVNFSSLDNNSTVIFNNAGLAVPPTSYGNLLINQSTSFSGTATAATVNGLLTIASGKTLGISNTKLSLYGFNGTIAGTGSLSSTSTASLDIFGANYGSNGTLYFADANASLRELSVTLLNGATDVLTLGNNLTITSGSLTVDLGSFNLNGKTLTIDANSGIRFPASDQDGVFLPAGGSLLINGTISTPSDLWVDASDYTFSSIFLNNASSSLGIGSPVIITDSISAKLGTIDLNGNVTLKATSSKTARIGQSAGTFNGNLTAEAYLRGTSSGWANLGSPGIAGQTVANWDTYYTSGGANGIPLACTGCYYTPASAGSFTSVFSWSESANDYVAATSATNLNPGTGLWTYVGTGLTTTSDLKMVHTGAPVVGNVNTTLTNGTGSGYNLVANPYASPISWSRLRANGSNSSLVANAVYVWNADLSSGAGAFATYINGVNLGISDIIPAGQGFYVQANSGGSLAFAESIKTTDNTSANPVLRPSRDYYGQIFRLKLAGQAGDDDEMAFRMHPMATPFFDGEWDAHKIFQTPGYAGYPGSYSKYTTISSKDALGQDYAVHSFPEPTKDLNIPLLVRVMQSGTYTITASGLENIPSCLILKDKLLNKTQDLQMGDYVFTISDTTSIPRFELQLCKGVGAANSLAETKIDARSVQILRAENGIQINTVFAENTRAKIEVFNLLGQSLYSAVMVDGTTNSTFIPVDLENTMVLVKVSTANDSFSKKVLLR